jgi:SAM-dependent methyltransferase
VSADERAGGDEVGFEEIYAGAGRDLGAIPWAALAPHPALVAWLKRTQGSLGPTTLVIGSGLGDDAEELARRGFRVTAFDLSPTAIERCRERFPESGVDYRVADLFALPDAWRAAFDVVVEIRTIQSLSPAQRLEAVSAIAATVRPGGRVFVHCFARDDDEPIGSRPWPVSRGELAGFADAELRELELLDRRDGASRSITAVYARPEPPEAADVVPDGDHSGHASRADSARFA